MGKLGRNWHLPVWWIIRQADAYIILPITPLLGTRVKQLALVLAGQEGGLVAMARELPRQQ